MSRIHEALKKAEQQSSTNKYDRKFDEPSGLLRSSQPVKVLITEAEILPPPAELPDLKTAVDSGVLQLDELRMKCVKTVWNPDPNFLVFTRAKDFPGGADQFRTLPSRLYRIRDTSPLSRFLT